MNAAWLTSARRYSVYVVLSAVVPILVTYGVLADTEASTWLALGAALLGTGGTTLAAFNTPVSRGRHARVEEE